MDFEEMEKVIETQDLIRQLANQSAEVREDEEAKFQRLVQQGLDAAALEAEGKNANVEWVQALKRAYPDVQKRFERKRNDGSTYFSGSRMVTNARVYDAVIEARKCTRPAAGEFICKHKNKEAFATEQARLNKRGSRAYAIRRAVIELTTKYRLGADPRQCMDALVRFCEENSRGKV